MKKLLKMTGIIALLVLGAVACQKAPSGSGTMIVKMKDAPIDFDSVIVEIVGVDVHYSGGWVSLPTNVGLYDLLELQNDVTAVLTSNAGLSVGKITQMRLILGNQNYVVVDNVASFIDLSSQDKNGLKFNLDVTINDGDTVEVLIDFDAAKSIVIKGDGGFKLKPVIKVESILYY